MNLIWHTISVKILHYKPIINCDIVKKFDFNQNYLKNHALCDLKFLRDLWLLVDNERRFTQSTMYQFFILERSTKYQN